jgi:hypothetical protein
MLRLHQETVSVDRLPHARHSTVGMTPVRVVVQTGGQGSELGCQTQVPRPQGVILRDGGGDGGPGRAMRYVASTCRRTVRSARAHGDHIVPSTRILRRPGKPPHGHGETRHGAKRTAGCKANTAPAVHTCCTRRCDHPSTPTAWLSTLPRRCRWRTCPPPPTPAVPGSGLRWSWLVQSRSTCMGSMVGATQSVSRAITRLAARTYPSLSASL